MSNLPNALRVGSPLIDRNDERPRQPRRTSTNGSRLSDLVGSRRSSTVSDFDGNEPPSRYSYARRDVSPPEEDITCPSPATPSSSRSNSLFSARAAPALPSLSEDEPLTSPFEVPGRQHSSGPSLPRSLSRRLGSLREGVPGQKKYDKLEDVDEESIDIDISGFGGPDIELHPLGDVDQPAIVLGGGMDYVREAHVSSGHKRGPSLADDNVRHAILKEAQKTGEILAVEEAAVDLGSLGGGHSSRTGTVISSNAFATGPKKSYFFPDDPHKPSWRPVSMRWPYITLLIVIALGLAGLQEFLCQLSMRRQKTNDGLIKFKNPKDIPTMVYFAWKYMPTMILVTYGVMWQIVDYEVKRLEPYYQLSKPEGATARESLNLDYLTFMSYLIPLMATRYKQWAVVWSSVATLTAGGLLPVLQSASVYMSPKHPTADEQKIVLISPIWSRSLTAAAALVAIHGVCLAVSLRRKSGLISDPNGIAGIAAMATKSHILADFEGLDTATNDVIHKKLRTRKYNLHKSCLWQGEFIRSSEKMYTAEKVENPHPIMLRLTAGIPYITYIILFSLLIPVFIFVPGANEVTTKLPFLMTALATVVKLLWGTLDISVRIVEPYYILSRRQAPPKTLTLDYTGTIPGYLSVKSALNGHWLVSMVGSGAILAEVLTVCVTSFTVDGKKFISGKGGDGSTQDDRVNTSETFRSFWISFGLSLSILIYLAVVACITYAKRRHIFLPRQPGSIAGVLAYIHQSRMLDDFVDTETMNSKKMTSHLEGLGKKYGLGWFNGRDGQDHCGVDQEPILAKYKHGYEWKKSRFAGEDVGNWEYF
jgi:Protein of unknown function (DUF3433)